MPIFLILFYLIKLPESVRWAWAVGKMDVANQVIAKMAEVNEVEVPDRFLLKQKPHLEAKNEVGMGSLIASSKLRGKQMLHNICKIT